MNKESKPEILIFRPIKLFLFAALVCEVLALLIRQGKLLWPMELVSKLTVAGVVLLLIYLVWDGLRRKYIAMSAQFNRTEKQMDKAEAEMQSESENQS